MKAKPRIALRPDDDGMLDDVVVEPVKMFRAEMMSETSLWIACYLPMRKGQHDTVAFAVWVEKGKLKFRVTETPREGVVYEGGSLRAE